MRKSEAFLIPSTKHLPMRKTGVRNWVEMGLNASQQLILPKCRVGPWSSSSLAFIDLLSGRRRHLGVINLEERLYFLQLCENILTR